MAAEYLVEIGRQPETDRREPEGDHNPQTRFGGNQGYRQGRQNHDVDEAGETEDRQAPVKAHRGVQHDHGAEPEKDQQRGRRAESQRTAANDQPRIENGDHRLTNEKTGEQRNQQLQVVEQRQRDGDGKYAKVETGCFVGLRLRMRGGAAAHVSHAAYGDRNRDRSSFIAHRMLPGGGGRLSLRYTRSRSRRQSLPGL
jgi:hypothetical protein